MTIFFRLCAAIMMPAVLLVGAHAEELEETSIFQNLEGVWVSDNDAFGSPAASTMRWSSDLNGRFFRIEYEVEVRRSPGDGWTFEGVGYYRAPEPEAETVNGYWADNSGRSPPRSKLSYRKMRSLPIGVLRAAKQGRTKYERTEDGEIRVTDWIKTDDGWRQFNQNVFRRVVLED